MRMFVCNIVYAVCITGFVAGMGQVRVFGGGDYKIIPAEYLSGFSLNPTVPATIGEFFGSTRLHTGGVGRVSIRYGEIAIHTPQARGG